MSQWVIGRLWLPTGCIQVCVSIYLIDFLNADCANHMPREANVRTTTQHSLRGRASSPASGAGFQNIICHKPSISDQSSFFKGVTLSHTFDMVCLILPGSIPSASGCEISFVGDGYHLSKWTVSLSGFLAGCLGFSSGIPNATAPTILESTGRFKVSLSFLSSKAPIQHDPTP